MKYFDEVVKHNIEFSKNGIVLAAICKAITSDYIDLIEELLSEYETVATKKKKKEIEQRLTEISTELEDYLGEKMMNYFSESIKTENKWLSDISSKFFDDKFDISEKLAEFVKKYPFATAGTVLGFASDISQRMHEKAVGLIESSYIVGADFEDLLDDADFDSIERLAYNNAEVIGEGIGNVYDRIVYTKNEKLIKKYQWVSILDTNTCPACGELNGKVFDDISKVPLYPVHRCCRCTLLSLPAETEPIDIPKYSDWIESQDEETKRNILGKTRYSLYREGMKISQFYANGKKINLKDLKK